MGAKTARPNRELPVAVDVEGGVISARDVKAAREVAADAMTERDFQRLAKQITDQARDEDSSLTRAARDRDRATPRDASQVDSARLRGDLPAEGEFRRALSGRQRKIRSAIKNQVMASAPASQHKAIRTMLTEEDAREWRRINGGLHVAAGDTQKLGDGDRAKVQRLDRAIQSYERLNDRTHKVYVAVELPDNHRDVRGLRDLQRICVPARQWPSINSHSLGTTCTKHRGTTVIGTWCSRLSPAAECIWADLTALRTPPTFCPGACNSRSPLPTTLPTKPVPAVSVNVSSCN